MCYFIADILMKKRTVFHINWYRGNTNNADLNASLQNDNPDVIKKLSYFIYANEK